MFITLVKDINEPLSRIYHDRLIEKRREMFLSDSEMLMNDQMANHTKNSTQIIQAICELMGLDYDSTPALVVSDSIMFESFFVIESSVDSIESQFKALRKISDDLRKNANHQDLQKILHHQSLVPFRDAISDVMNLNTHQKYMISEVLDLSESNRQFRLADRIRNTANTFFNYLFQNRIYPHESKLKLMSVLMPLREDSGGHQPERMNSSPPTNVFYSRIPDNDPHYEIIEQVSDRWLDIETSTMNWLKGADHVTRKMSDFMRDTGDYSYYTMPVCKAFETEINRSVVQLMRKVNQIKMPDYYHRHCPLFGKLEILPTRVFPTGAEPIALNAKTKSGWLAPGLGQSRIAYDHYVKDGNEKIVSWLDNDGRKQLLDNWRLVYEIRNKSAHPNQVSLETRNTLDQIMMQFMQSDILNRLTSLKDELRKPSSEAL
jgi:hypothetical protein